MRCLHSTCGMLLASMLACRPPADDPRPPPSEPAVAATATTPPAPTLAIQPPADARITASGVAIDVLDPGDASAPLARPGDVLELRYQVWDEEGGLVGASRPNRSERLATTWLPAGWAEAMYTLHVGAHAHLWVPATQAYGMRPDGPRGELRIDVELVDLERVAELVVELPSATPPPNALRTASGLSFLVLRQGPGTRHPAADARVTVHYEGWTADGNRFDSSYERGKPTTFPLSAVIAGWQEAVPLMVEGEKTRFWIPGDMAYGDQPGRPNGMLVFDIELIHIDS